METSLNFAFDYLLKNKKYFNVQQPSVVNEAIKPFIELVFLYNGLLMKMTHSEQRETLKFYIFSQIETINFHEKLEDNNVIISGVTTLEEFLLLHKQSKFNDFLTKLVTEKKDILTQRTPFRNLDTKYSLNQVNISDNLPSYEQLYYETILGKGLSAYYLTPMGMYSITHTIFYLTNMGRSKEYLYLLADKSELLKNLLTENMMRNDLDILAEVVMCCFFMQLEEDEDMRELLAYAINFIVAGQLVDGSFPAPIDDTQNLNQKEIFQLRYHTTLVCIGALICYREKF